MARALVTGATGFIGYHVARALRREGYAVRALAREGSDTADLADLGVEIIRGDLRDDGKVLSAAKGCEQLYHVAADYRLWVPDPGTMYAINVQGTINVMEAALRQGMTRVVYTSTVGVLAPGSDAKPGNEESHADFRSLVGHYKKSKYLAEQEVRRYIAKGLPVVIVNPTAPIGTMDRKPTPTGKTIVDFLNGKMPAYLDTGLNFVDVEDVAEGHIRAGESGVIGESYILGNENLRLKEFLELLAGLTGRKPPRWKLPYTPILCLASVDHVFSKALRRKEAAIPLDGVRMARHYMFFDSSKAVEKLGVKLNPVREAARKAIEWYGSHGYIRSHSLLKTQQ